MTPSSSPCEHLIQAYTDDAFLGGVVAAYVGVGLARREGVVVIATPAHVKCFSERVAADGHDVSAAVSRRQLLFLEAELTLARFMVDGRLDRSAFVGVVSAALDHVRDAGHPSVRLYGEMVDLLWERQFDATLELERLGNETLVDERVSLLCAYRVDPLDRHAHGIFRQITHCHSRLLPVADSERFEEAVDRAYAEVFGVSADVTALRELMVSRQPHATVVSPAHAVLFALDDMPPLIANEIRARARQHYRRGTRPSSSLRH